MSHSALTQLSLEISASDTTAEDVDWMTRQLLSETREIDVESAELKKDEEAPKGSKGDPLTPGSVVISSLPAVLPAVVALVQVWASRGQGRTMKFKGRRFEFEGSPEKFQKLLATLEKGKKK